MSIFVVMLGGHILQKAESWMSYLSIVAKIVVFFLVIGHVSCDENLKENVSIALKKGGDNCPIVAAITNKLVC